MTNTPGNAGDQPGSGDVELEKLKKEAADAKAAHDAQAYETRKLKEQLEAQKAELGQKTLSVEEQVKASSNEIKQLRLENAKMKAIAKHQLSEEDAQFLDGSTSEEIASKAEKLAERLAKLEVNEKPDNQDEKAGGTEKVEVKSDDTEKVEVKSDDKGTTTTTPKPPLPKYDAGGISPDDLLKNAREDLKELIEGGVAVTYKTGI